MKKRETDPESPRLSPPRLLGSLATGALVVFSFPLYGSEAGLDGLIWVALVPLFLASVGVGWRRGLALGACAGLTLEAAGFIWILLAIRRFTGLPWPVAALGFLGWVAYSSVPWALLGAALGASRRPAGVLWVLPFWVGLEHHYPRLFPWHLGGALHAHPWLLQTVDVWGASGLTILVLLSNACVFLWIVRLRLCRLEGLGWGLRPWKQWPWKSSGALAALLVAAILYGRHRLPQVERLEGAAGRFRVALVQRAIDPRDKKTTQALEQYMEATKRLLETTTEGVDLVVWPEGADSRPFDLTPGHDPWAGHRVSKTDSTILLRDAFRVPVITGAWGWSANESPEVSNILAFLEPGQPPQFYEKNVRVPFGEVVPLLDLLPRSFRESLGISVRTIRAGTSSPLFGLGNMDFRGLICYEATIPGYFRETSRATEGRGPDFLVNLTEDIWYGRTAHIPQHVSVLRLRAVENRMPVVRVTNVGPSGVVDATGRFRAGRRLFEPEEIVLVVRAGSLPTAYQSVGHAVPGILLVGSALYALLACSRRRRASS